MPKKIVIVGAGFAGFTLAQKLRNTPYHVTLVDKNNYHQFPPLFYQVAMSGLEPSAISFPLRAEFKGVKNFNFCMAEVTGVNAAQNKILTSIGELGYEYLVLAAGADTNYFGLRNIEKYAYPMKSVSESLALRNQVLQCFELATTCIDEAEKQRLLNFVVVGGGATGVEVAGSLGEMKKFIVHREYPELDPGKVRIMLLERADKLLGALSPQSSADAMRSLRKLGVEAMLGVGVEDYDGTSVKLSNGAQIESRTLIWGSGIVANTLEGIPIEAIGRGRRIQVDEFNRVKGFDSIFALGDQCLQTEKKFTNGHPQVAQVAIQQARNLAYNFQLMLHQKPLQAFGYKDKGSMATIGRHLAVVDLKHLHYNGFLAWATWLLVHLVSLVGVKNKFMVFWDWMWEYFTYDASLRIIIKPKVKNNG